MRLEILIEELKTDPERGASLLASLSDLAAHGGFSARKLLKGTAVSITDIAPAVGYFDVTTFERNFVKEVGASPIAYRAKALRKTASGQKAPRHRRPK